MDADELQNIKPVMRLADLTLRETEALRLHLNGMHEPRLLGRAMGCKPSTATVHLHNARRKLKRAQSIYAAAQQQLAEEEVQWDAEGLAIGGARDWYRFLLKCMRPPRHDPSGPLIGLTWIEYLYGAEIRQAVEGAVHAGPVVTVDDLMALVHPLRESLQWRPLTPEEQRRQAEQARIQASLKKKGLSA